MKSSQFSFLFILCPFLILGLDTSFLPPEMPIDEEYPLLITLENEDQWITNSAVIEREKEIISSALEARADPWAELIIVIFFGGLSWILYVTRESWVSHIFPSPTTSALLLRQIKKTFFKIKRKLERDAETDPSSLSCLLRLIIAYKERISAVEMTYEELSKVLKNGEETKELCTLHEIEKALFSGKELSSSEIRAFFNDIERYFLQLLSSSK